MFGNTAFVVFQTTKCLIWDNSPKKHLHNPFHNSTKRPTEGHEREHGVAGKPGKGSLGTFFPSEWFPPRLFSTWRRKQMIATYLACLWSLGATRIYDVHFNFGGSLILRHLQNSKTMTQGSHNLTLWNDKMSQGFPSLWNWRVMQHEGWHLDMVTEFWDAPANQWYHQICCMIRTLLAPHEMASKKWYSSQSRGEEEISFNILCVNYTYMSPTCNVSFEVNPPSSPPLYGHHQSRKPHHLRKPTVDKATK